MRRGKSQKPRSSSRSGDKKENETKAKKRTGGEKIKIQKFQAIPSDSL